MDAELAHTLRTGPFHVALRAAIAKRGLALRRLQHRLDRAGLHVGVGTLSYWQSGRRRPERPESLRAVAILETILGVPEQSLLVLLGPPRSRRPVLARGARRYADVLAPAGVLPRLLAGLGEGYDARLHLVSTYDEITVSSGQCDYLQVVAAHREADRHIAIYEGDPGCVVSDVRVDALQNCRVGRVRRDPASALVVAELLFDTRLRVGDTHILGYRFTDPSGVPGREYRRGMRFPAQQVAVQVRFDPASMPVRCWRFAKRSAHGPDEEVTEVTPGPHHAIHVLAHDRPPGIVGLRWSWD